MNLFGGWALSTPMLLALLPGAIAALVYAYRRYGRGLRRPVGTVFLLKALERTPSARRQFKPPPRFFLELLLLTLLIVGGAGLYNRAGGERVLVVLDNSLSMGVVPPGEGKNVLERSRSLAQSVIESLPSDTQIAVTTTGAPAVEGFLDLAGAAQAIDDVAVGYHADNIERLLARFGSDARFDRVIAFTDRQPQFASPESRSRLEVQTIMRARSSNIAVSDVAIRTTPTGTQNVQAVLSSYAEQAVDLGVVLEAIEPDGSVTVVKRETVALAPGTSRALEFNNLNRTVVAYRVALVSPPGQRTQFNALSADDEGWVGAAPSSEAIIVVSDLSSEALGLTRLRHLRFTVIKPSDWSEKSAAATRTVIFHRFTPPTLPPVNALFVMPPTGGPFEVGPPLTDTAITRWNVADPLASYLNLPALLLKAVTPLSLPPWGREAIATTGGVAAFTGSHNGNRIIVTGFEIFPYEGSRSRLMSILTLNALGWLADTSIGFEPTGTRVELSQKIDRVRYNPGEIVWQRGDPQLDSVVLEHPGVVALKNSDGSETARVVNFFDERESNTLTPAPFTVERVAPADRGNEMERRYLAPAIAILGLLLLLLDLFLFAPRRPSSNLTEARSDV